MAARSNFVSASRLCRVPLGLALAGLALSAAAQVVTVIVPGTANPWLAGMPDGTTAISSDSAPAQSPVLVTGIDLSLGGSLTFSNATGGVLHTPGCPTSCDPIDGSTFFAHSGGDEHGIAGLTAPINSLVGVFLDLNQPDLTVAPAALNFQTLGLDLVSLAPGLKQVFFIGNGMTSANLVQQFAVPAGAFRLYLGTMDGFGWFNNSGAITVDVNGSAVTAVPEPTTYAVLAAGLAMVAAAVRRRRAG